MSWTGIPSVIAITVPMPGVDRLVDRGGGEARRDEDHRVLAPRSSTASLIVSKTGMPSTSWPPFFGVTPATTSVP